MKLDLPEAEIRRLERIRSKINIDINNYLTDGYEAVALHSSSIILEVNQACADMFGYTRDELIFMNAWKFFPLDSVKDLMHHLVTKSQAPYRVKANNKDGSLFTVELKGYDFEIEGEPVRSVLLKKIV